MRPAWPDVVGFLSPTAKANVSLPELAYAVGVSPDFAPALALEPEPAVAASLTVTATAPATASALADAFSVEPLLFAPADAFVATPAVLDWPPPLSDATVPEPALPDADAVLLSTLEELLWLPPAVTVLESGPDALPPVVVLAPDCAPLGEASRA